MLGSLIRWCLRVACWALSAVGIAALLLAVMIATPLVAPPELRSISAARGTVDMSTLPAIERFQARDGTALGFRHYAAIGPSTRRAAIVVHGSSGASANTIQPLSWGLRRHRQRSGGLENRGHEVA